MTGNKEIKYWKTNKEWYKINASGEYELTNLATERARKSFKLYNSKK